MPSSVPGGAEEASNDAVSSGGRSGGGGGEPVPLRAEAADAPPPSNADRINRADGRVTDKSRCDFNDSKSVNKYYPPHKGKGRHNVPQTLIDQCQSDAAKKRAVEEWRMLTRKQQQERKDTLHAEEKKRKADERAAKRGATKRRKARESAEQKKQKADDRRAKETERKRKAREESKNKKIQGMLSTGGPESDTSDARPPARKKPRKASEPVTIPKHLVDKASRRTMESTERASMRYANAVRPSEGVDLKGAVAEQAVVTIHNVGARQTRNGGGQSAAAANQILEEPIVRFVAPAGMCDDSLRALHSAIGAELERRGGEGAEAAAARSSPLRSRNVTFAVGTKQVEKLHKAKKRAPKGQSQEQVRQNLGAAIDSQPFGSPISLAGPEAATAQADEGDPEFDMA